jgi:hypothetical protein
MNILFFNIKYLDQYPFLDFSRFIIFLATQFSIYLKSLYKTCCKLQKQQEEFLFVDEAAGGIIYVMNSAKVAVMFDI